MRIVLIAALLAIGNSLSAVGNSQTTVPDKGATAPFEILLSTETPVIGPNGDITISIELKNLSEHDIDCGAVIVDGLDTEYRYIIKNTDGNPVPMRKSSHPEGSTGRFVLCTLASGKSYVQIVRGIDQNYDLSEPGTYTIQVSRVDDGKWTIAPILSNIITVTVLPASPPPAQQ